jgi:hypothetical protein
MFEAEDSKRVLLIIISFEEVKITESYHKFLGLTRSGVGCEGDWNGFVILISTI